MDTFLILTDMENAQLNFEKENEKPLYKVTLSNMKKHRQEDHFLTGSTVPKAETCL